MENHGSTGMVSLLVILCLIFLAPALICGGALGIGNAAIFGSAGGWLCSLFFWVMVVGGRLLFKQIQKSNEDEDD